MNFVLTFCYFVIGFVLSFPAVATQYTFIYKLKVSPVFMAFAFSLVSIPWCLKPLYGFISDKYAILNWGKRRPYVAYSCLFAAYMYMIMGKMLDDLYGLLSILVFTSLLLCVADVCVDSITVEMVKKYEKHGEGIIQSNNWIGRASGSLVGAFLGGMAYDKLGADAVYKLTAVAPFFMACIVWYLPKSEFGYRNMCDKLLQNIIEQKNLIYILLFMNISPSYNEFYVYFLTEELHYTPIDFTWLNMSASISFLAGVTIFRLYFREWNMRNVLCLAVLSAVLFRLPQLLVVTKTYTSFWLVLLDGIAESFCGQLMIMPLIVYTATQCNDGVEGSLFALMMSVSNLSGVISNQSGAYLANILKVDKTNFDQLKWLMVISIALDVIIPLLVIQSMFSASSSYHEVGRTPELRMINLRQDPLANSDHTTATEVRANSDRTSEIPEHIQELSDSDTTAGMHQNSRSDRPLVREDFESLPGAPLSKKEVDILIHLQRNFGEQATLIDAAL